MMQVVMPRRQREGMAGHVFHVINRGARRQTLFASPDDYRRFQHLMQEATARTPMPIYVFCLMSTHFHFVVHPETDEQLPEFMRWLCCTHAKRFNRDHGTVGIGAVYQARYRAFPVQTDAHFLRVCRYVERNPLRAGLVTHAERWPWSSLGQRGHNFDRVAVRPWPIPRPSGWTAWVNQVVTVAEELAIRECLQRSRPYGDEAWVLGTSDRLGLQHTLKRIVRRPPKLELVSRKSDPDTSSMPELKGVRPADWR
jgi:putative transposase